jgi:ABC-type sugar transport system ATPase subunit
VSEAALLVDHVSKHFGGVKALTDIHLEFNKGEIVGLVGSNGAGKSTLLNVIWGAFAPDSGNLFVDGEEVRKISPEKAHKLGISIIFQHRRLMPYMTIAENIFIDNMPKRAGMIDYGKMHRDAAELLQMLGLKISSRRLVTELTAEEKQLVEIVKACSRSPKILLMDEPTTALRQHEVETLFGIMRNLRDKGCCVVFISHRLREVMEVCDRIAIIRDGRNVIDGPKDQFTPASIVDHMIGQRTQPVAAQKVATSGKSVAETTRLLSTDRLKVNDVHDVNFTLHQGEILGFAGLGGSGIDDIFSVLFGLQKPQSGMIEIDGKTVEIRNPVHAIKQGIGFVPEDRQLCGEFLGLTVQDNICIPNGQERALFSKIKRKEERLASEGFIDRLSIKTESAQTPIGNLSGGNQQKAVIAKWLHVGSRIILMSEPTAGIDVAAKSEVNRFIQEIASSGKGILYTSSYIAELMEVADRIIVIYKGEVFKVFARSEFDNNKIYLAMNGLEASSTLDEVNEQQQDSN